MESKPEKMRAKCLCIDIETARQDHLKLKEIGVYRPDLEIRKRWSGKAPGLVAELNRVSEGAAFVLGHNIIAFDQPALSELLPGLALHHLPMIDTLVLSPIAFPQNPYHRLVKDYKLCSTTRNDPVRDAELAYELFLDEAEALRQRVQQQPDEVLCLHFFLTSENGKGMANFFATLRKALRPSFSETQNAWQRATADKVCRTAQQQVMNERLNDPDWGKPLAYVLSWLQVAGGNSILPPWVMQNVPKTRELMTLLRDVPCRDPDCLWCQEQHDLAKLLPRYFPGIEQFRPTPTTEDGRSLQQVMVENGFAGQPTLAILPTGGGKSLCYQLPALARFYRNSSLTVIISPLQSLMKDQVDNLVVRGIDCAGYLNSLLNPLERSVVLNKLRFGDLGLIFVAPEQFRSLAFTQALTHREIGAWVFDEAHCLSKWGHDFRPDYLYVSRFIKKRQNNPLSPVFCFTATAKPDVVQDIVDHFKKQLNIDLQPWTGGVKRENLYYEVHAVQTQSKFPEVLRLLQDALQDDGGAIVFCARQKTVEAMAEFLNQAGLDCGYFHGGMTPENKRQVQEAFINGELRVIAATNAFGMGVDKADVRLVLHLDTPGSLENYLQEAGRAGRDQEPARCVLLYDDADLEVQFRLLRNAKLTQHDIAVILKALRRIEKKDRSESSVVVTSGEILLEIPDKHSIDPDAKDADTKVRIAIAWLEEARLLERQENHTRVFPGCLQIASLDEARAALEEKLPKTADPEPYLAILSALFFCKEDESLSTDDLMLATGSDSQGVMQLLRDLNRLQLVTNDNEIGVMFYHNPDTPERLEALRQLENALLDCLREAAPDADQQEWQILNMRRLCDTLRRESNIDLTPDRLSKLLKSFAEAFGTHKGQQGFFALHPAGQDHRKLKLLRSWPEIEHIRHKRMRLAQALLQYFARHRQGNQLLVTCKQGDLELDLQADLTLQDLDIRDWNLALAAALIYLDTNEVLHLARGKAVFRAAMNIQLNTEARRRQFKKSDYAELALHYEDKIIQVHVMAEYARLAVGKIQAAMAFIVDYFGMERDAFVRRYFSGRQDILKIATTEIRHRRILTDLKNPEQQAIVMASLDNNHLVLAGPGSGKTKVIVHRVAWLLCECMVRPEDIMILTYNRSAALEIRHRLRNLAGDDAAGVTIQTLHGLALRLTGTSYAVAAEHGETIDFANVIQLATQYLQPPEDPDEPEPGILRDRLLSGLRYLLVDEYQDINQEHYDFISALVGRTLRNEEDRPVIMAVGDDDQNIYAFGGASVRFIRQFCEDYQAQTHYLIENYRSSGHIVHCANQVIAKARERMKDQQTLRINYVRRDLPAGGIWASIDPLTQGQVHILETMSSDVAEASVVYHELLRLNRLVHQQKTGYWGRFAVIARHWDALEPLAALCRQQGLPVQLLRDDNRLDLHSTREGQSLLSLLRRSTTNQKRTLIRCGALSRWFRHRYQHTISEFIAHPYQAMLAQFITEVESFVPEGEYVVSDIIEWLYEFRSGYTTLNESIHSPLLLLTAHRAKGLEFEHVIILDAGGWTKTSDDERRLFYVAMTRAKQTLSLCLRQKSRHAFIKDCEALCLKSRPQIQTVDDALSERLWVASPAQVVLSWPGYFAAHKPVHQALAKLDYGSELILRPRQDDNTRWEIADTNGITVTRMATAFQPPNGKILQVRVAAILSRSKKPGDSDAIKTETWEVVVPEISYMSLSGNDF